MQQIWWEATFFNGRVVSQKQGASYESLDRAHLSHFLLRDEAGPIVELVAEAGRSGHNLVYRRRTVEMDGIQVEVDVLGWIPQGPIYAVDPEALQVYQSDTFLYGDPVFYPPLPMWFEQWDVAQPTRIINPSFERID